MPFFNAPAATAALSANGDTTNTGYVTVASNADFYPGAHVWMTSSGQTPREYIVTDLISTTLIGLKPIPAVSGKATYNKAPLSQWTTAQSARIDQEAQTVPVEKTYIKKPLP